MRKEASEHLTPRWRSTARMSATSGLSNPPPGPSAGQRPAPSLPGPAQTGSCAWHMVKSTQMGLFSELKFSRQRDRVPTDLGAKSGGFPDCSRNRHTTGCIRAVSKHRPCGCRQQQEAVPQTHMSLASDVASAYAGGGGVAAYSLTHTPWCVSCRHRSLVRRCSAGSEAKRPPSATRRLSVVRVVRWPTTCAGWRVGVLQSWRFALKEIAFPLKGNFPSTSEAVL